MKKSICVAYATDKSLIHCQEGSDYVNWHFKEFAFIRHTNKLIIFHAFCRSSIESKHESCYFLEHTYFNTYCRLAPQAKITSVLVLDGTVYKRMLLHLLNEPYNLFIITIGHYKNLKYLAQKCSIDSVSQHEIYKTYIWAICPECNMEYFISY